MTKTLKILALLLLALPAYAQPERDQLLAPIAHYPAPLRSLMIRAAHCPVDIIEAAHWLRATPGLRGDAAVRAAQYERWDPNVKALLAYPQVLAWMDENLDWTRRLGEAFFAPPPPPVARTPIYAPPPAYAPYYAPPLVYVPVVRAPVYLYRPPVVVTRIVTAPPRHPVHVHPQAHSWPHHGGPRNSPQHAGRRRS
jgi:hypothetical protein